MIDDKTTEKLPPQQQQTPPTLRGRLRSFWARLQCSILLRRHSMRGKTRSLLELLHSSPAVLWLGAALYDLGFATEYRFVRVGRWFKNSALKLAHTVRGLCVILLTTAFPGAAQVAKDIFGPIYLLIRGIILLPVHAWRAYKQNGFGGALRACWRFVAGGVKRNIAMLPRMAMYALPLCALLVMFAVVRYVITLPYALAVRVNGEVVGYVASEDVFESARADLEQRINYAGAAGAEWSVEPTYSVAVASSLLDENEMASAILRASGSEISEGTALYLDGELTAVCADGNALQSYLSSLLEPYADEEDTSTTVAFNKAVTIEKGIYFNKSFKSIAEIEELLSGVSVQQKTYTVQAGDTISGIASKNGLTMRELCALNTDFVSGDENGLTQTSTIKPGDELTVTREEAMLEVRITKTATTDEEIAYSTETTKSSDYTVGTTKTVQDGENGIRRVTTQTVYNTSGEVLEQSVINSEVVKEPVNEQIVVGTKKVTAETAYITGSGQFIWPVPGYRYCSRWFGGSHKGVDICAAAGTPIYASAAGTVSKAGYNKAGAGTGYGYSAIINHSGGYSTVYAHCTSLVVHAGQTVKQGQLIGYVGSTGRSTGNHCHFEIRLNGTKLSVQKFFPSYYK